MAFISMPTERDVGEVLTVVIIGGEVVVWDVELASVILDFKNADTSGYKSIHLTTGVLTMCFRLHMWHLRTLTS